MNIRGKSAPAVRLAPTHLVVLTVLCAMALCSSAFAIRFPTTHVVADIAVGDMNGDGFADIVTCGTAGDRGSVNVLLGNGDGTFQRPTQAAVGNAPAGVILGDFNVDGHLDVATADSGTPNISVLLGNGDGTLQPRQRINVGAMPNALASADFDEDGIPDWAVAVPSGFVVVLGDGSGGSRASNSITTIPATAGITVGDWDGDGNTDVVFGGLGFGANLYLGNGDGTFRLSPLTIPLVKPLLIDVDGDGKDDVAGLDDIAHNNFDILLSLGNTFQQKFGVQFMGEVDDITAGDFNNDGEIDFAITVQKSAQGLPDLLYTILGNGDGTAVAMSTKISVGAVIAAGFFDADGNLDIAGGDGVNSYVETAYGLGTGKFRSQ
jgi:large repetitive protein